MDALMVVVDIQARNFVVRVLRGVDGFYWTTASGRCFAIHIVHCVQTSSLGYRSARAFDIRGNS